VLVQYKIILYIVIVERFLKKKLKLKIQWKHFSWSTSCI
jgi:hypothetical protein